MSATTLDLEAAAALVVERSEAEATEVITVATEGGLTRFANSEIHQNVVEQTVSMRIRVIDRGRVGVASTNQLDERALRQTLERARVAAAAQEPQADLPGLAGPAQVAATTLPGDTAASTPALRAEMVSRMCATADSAGVRAFGVVSADVATYGIRNSAGLQLSSPRSVATARMTAMDESGSSGFGARTSQSIGDLDIDAVAAEATDRAVRHREPVALDAGHYPVVMEEEAIGELLEYLAAIGFGAQDVEEGRTFFRPGQRLTGPAIHLWDDGNDPSGLPMPFDFEGTPRRRVELVRGGVATDVVHDLASAARAGVSSTGHGLPAPNPSGPAATNLFLAGGEAEGREDLCAGIKRGIWVTRLWYVNIVDATTSTLTGMTREGTFLIEDGRVSRPIKDMRFTQDVMEAFASCSAATRQTRLVAGSDYGLVAGYRVPAMRLDRFNFTSATR